MLLFATGASRKRKFGCERDRIKKFAAATYAPDPWQCGSSKTP